MQPIVNGIKKQYRACLKLERVNFHSQSEWHNLIAPVGSPEFALLSSSGEVIYRWFGFTDKDEFVEVMSPICGT